MKAAVGIEHEHSLVALEVTGHSQVEGIWSTLQVLAVRVVKMLSLTQHLFKVTPLSVKEPH